MKNDLSDQNLTASMTPAPCYVVWGSDTSSDKDNLLSLGINVCLDPLMTSCSLGAGLGNREADEGPFMLK